MTGTRAGARVFSATQVAKFCRVDLKTIHNWANRGKIRGFRTPGRHLRFRRMDVLDFLRAYEFPIPDALRHAKPRVAVVETDAHRLAAMHRALSRRFDVLPFAHVVDAILHLASADVDALVLGHVSPLDAAQLADRLRVSEAVRHVRIVVLNADATEPEPSSPRGDVLKLRETLERLTGIE